MAGSPSPEVSSPMRRADSPIVTTSGPPELRDCDWRSVDVGIGSNVAIFSVANAVLFRPLPYSSPEELVLVWNRLLATDVPRALVSGPDFLDYQNQATSFEGFAGAFAVAGTLTGEGPAEQVMSAWITPNLFQVLGVAPMLGRDFEAEDEAPVDFELFMDPTADLPPGVVILRYGGKSASASRSEQARETW